MDTNIIEISHLREEVQRQQKVNDILKSELEDVQNDNRDLEIQLSKLEKENDLLRSDAEAHERERIFYDSFEEYEGYTFRYRDELTRSLFIAFIDCMNSQNKFGLLNHLEALHNKALAK